MSLPMCAGSGTSRIHAFSLAELLVVFSLIAVLAGAAIVALQDREDPHALRSSAEDLATALRYAVNRADSTQRPHRVVFEAGGFSYRVEQLEFENEDWTAVDGMPGRRHRLVNGIAMMSNSNSPSDGLLEEPLVCAFGSGINEFTGSIMLYTAAGDVLRIEVMPITRQIRIAEGVLDS